MISYYLQVILLAFIQGISEFIPVSSSAHLVLISSISQFDYGSLELDISLHLGSLLAIIVYFWRDLMGIFNNKKLISLIFFGSVPLILIGYIFHSYEIIYIFRNLKIIAWTTLLFGILLYYADKRPELKKINKNLNLINILIIGLFQVLALIPGVSRSGIVITASRIYNFERVEAAKISFFLSIPALSGASFLGIKNVLDVNLEISPILIISMFLSFVFSFLTIKFLLLYLKSFSLKIFVYYRLILSILLFLVAYS